MRVELEPDAGRRIEPDDELIGFGAASPRESDARRALKAEPQLRLGHRETLAGADEERHAGPAPVLDLELERRVRLRGRVGGNAVDRAVAVVLAAHVVLRARRLYRVEERGDRVLERVSIGARWHFHRRCRHDLYQV